MPSAVVRNFTYDAEIEVLTITFQTGRRYWYVNVPESVYRSMKAAVGKEDGYFDEHIRGVYAFRRCSNDA